MSEGLRVKESGDSDWDDEREKAKFIMWRNTGRQKNTQFMTEMDRELGEEKLNNLQ